MTQGFTGQPRLKFLNDGGQHEPRRPGMEGGGSWVGLRLARSFRCGKSRT